MASVFPLTELCEISATLRELEERLSSRRNRKKEASLAARGDKLARELKARVEKAYPTLTKNDFPISGLDSLTKTLTEFSTIPSPRREILIHIARTTADEELIVGLRWHAPFASASEVKAAFATADRQRRIRPERFLNEHLCQSAKG